MEYGLKNYYDSFFFLVILAIELRAYTFERLAICHSPFCCSYFEDRVSFFVKAPRAGVTNVWDLRWDGGLPNIFCLRWLGTMIFPISAQAMWAWDDRTAPLCPAIYWHGISQTLFSHWLWTAIILIPAFQSKNILKMPDQFSLLQGRIRLLFWLTLVYLYSLRRS
jgi:hypothetical protein